MMKILFSIFMVSMFMGTKCNSQGGGQEQSWIARLKATPVAKMDAGLPQKPFGQWFIGQTKDAQPRYELKDCGPESGAPTTSGKCITVTADVASVRRIELTFAVPADDAPAKNAEGVSCTFVRGMIWPSDPRSKQPTRLIRKLADLPAASTTD